MQAIGNFLSKFKLAEEDNRNKKEVILKIINKHINGCLDIQDINLGQKGLVRLDMNVSGPARSEINLNKAKILSDLVENLGKKAPVNIK